MNSGANLTDGRVGLPPLGGGAASGVEAALAAIRRVQGGMTHQPPGAERLDLGTLLEVRSAKVLKDRLAELIARREPCRLNGSSVQRVSTGGIQLLVAFFAAAEALGMTAALDEPSAALDEAIQDLGLGGVAARWMGN